MAITKNPILYLWLRSVSRTLSRNKALFSVLGMALLLGLAALLFIPIRSTTTTTSQAPSVSPVSRSQTPNETEDYCNQLMVHTFVAAPGPGKQINYEKKRCALAVRYDGQCIYVYKSKSAVRHGPFCNWGKESLPQDVTFAWSAGAAFTNYVQRHPPVER